MFNPKLTDEELQVTLDTVKAANGNKTLAAETLHIARSTLNNRLERAAERGLDPHTEGGAVPLGFTVVGHTTLHRTDEGRVLQWVRDKRDPHLIGDPVPAIQAAFENFKGLGLNPYQVGVEGTDFDRVTVYVIADLHLGMYSWKKETGNDFDVYIADKLFTSVIHELVQDAPSTEQAIILNLGDFFHSDNNEHRTLRSGNALDVDTRYAQVMQMGTDLILQATHLALQKHDKVLLVNIPGNHDPYGTIALNLALRAYYHNHDRVTVREDTGPFWFYEFGRTMIGATHGDMAKPHQMVNIMAAKEPEMWGRTAHRYVYLGHIHRKTKGATLDTAGEIGGAQWETFQTIAPRDAWGNSMGFTAGRSMQAIVLHKDRGEKVRYTATVEGKR